MPHLCLTTPGLWVGPPCRTVRLPYAALQHIELYSAVFCPLSLPSFQCLSYSSADKYFVQKSLLTEMFKTPNGTGMRKCRHSFCAYVSLVRTTRVFMCVSVGGQPGCEIRIDVSIWRQVFRVWLRAAAASLHLGLLPLSAQLHHWPWLLVVIEVWNLNMVFHHSKFVSCWCTEACG